MSIRMVSARIGLVILMCLVLNASGLRSQISISAGLARLQAVAAGLSEPQKSQVERIIERLKEAQKNKDAAGKADPKLIDGTKWFKKKRRPTAKGYIGPDKDLGGGKGEHKPGLGPDQVLRINLGAFGKTLEAVEKYCPPPSTTEDEAEDFVNTYVGMVMLKEGAGIDLTGNTPADRPYLEYWTTTVLWTTMVEVTYVDPCLQALWAILVKKAHSIAQNWLAQF